MELAPNELYMWYTGLVSRGMLSFEQSAREVAERHDFPLSQINNALYDGQKIAYERYVKWIRNGRLAWVDKARDLSQKLKYPAEDLEAAIEEGKKVKPALQH